MPIVAIDGLAWWKEGGEGEGGQTNVRGFGVVGDPFVVFGELCGCES